MNFSVTVATPKGCQWLASRDASPLRVLLPSNMVSRLLASCGANPTIKRPGLPADALEPLTQRLQSKLLLATIIVCAWLALVWCVTHSEVCLRLRLSVWLSRRRRS